MTPNRRDFVKWLALIAAGAAAQPDQIRAFEEYYDANTPRQFSSLIAVDEILVSGMSTSSLPVDFIVYRKDHMELSFSVNLFGGIIRWVPAPNQIRVIDPADLHISMDTREVARTLDEIRGHISYVDQHKHRHTDPIREWIEQGPK